MFAGALAGCAARHPTAGLPPGDVLRAGPGERADAYLTRLVPFGFSGTVMVARRDTVLLDRAYGSADRTTDRALELNTPFMIGSVTKQFTAAAILALEEDGVLSVHDALGRWLAEAPPDKAGITLHQLLTHTSGLPYHTDRDFLEVRPRAAVYAEMLGLPLEFTPGAGWTYSNPGFTLLGAVIERASGLSYEDYLVQRLFRRAGMTRTSFESDRSGIDPAQAVHSYAGELPGEQGQGPITAFPPTPKGVGAGTVITTAGELYRWQQSLLEGRVLRPSNVARLLQPQHRLREDAAWGYGWEIRTTLRGTTVLRSFGDIGGYNAEMRRYPDEDGVTLIVTSAVRVRGRGMREAVLNPISRILAGEESRCRRRPLRRQPRVRRPVVSARAPTVCCWSGRRRA